MHEDRRKRVLIIEDEASIGLMVAEILADEGFGVIGPVGNRREALSALEDRQRIHAHRAHRPDLIGMR